MAKFEDAMDAVEYLMYRYHFNYKRVLRAIDRQYEKIIDRIAKAIDAVGKQKAVKTLIEVENEEANFWYEVRLIVLDEQEKWS